MIDRARPEVPVDRGEYQKREIARLLFPVLAVPMAGEAGIPFW